MMDDIDPEQELESTDDQLDAGAEQPSAGSQSHLSTWIRVGVGVAAVILVIALAGPRFLGWPGQSGKGETQPSPPTEENQDQVGTASLQPDSAYSLAGENYRAGQLSEAWTQFRTVDAYAAAVKTRPEIASAEQAVQSDPSSKEAHFRLGTAWARAQLWIPAEVAFRQAIALDSRYVDAYVNLGVVYYQMSRLTDALAQYDAALAINPNDADVHNNRGAVYVQQALQVSPPDETLLDLGVKEWQRALEIKPGLAQAYFSLGVVHFLRGQKGEAIPQFEKFLELDDGSDSQATEQAKSYLQQLGQ